MNLQKELLKTVATAITTAVATTVARFYTEQWLKSAGVTDEPPKDK